MNGLTLAEHAALFPSAFLIDDSAASTLDRALACQKSRQECGEPGLRVALATFADSLRRATDDGFSVRMCHEEAIDGINLRTDDGGRTTPFRESQIHTALVELLETRKARTAARKTNTGSGSSSSSLTAPVAVSSAAGFLYPDADLRQSCGSSCIRSRPHADVLLDILHVLEVKALQPASTIDRMVERWRVAVVINGAMMLRKTEEQLVEMARKGNSALAPLVTTEFMSRVLKEGLPPLVNELATRNRLDGVVPLSTHLTWRIWEELVSDRLRTEHCCRATLERIDADSKTRVGTAQSTAYLMTTSECGNGVFATAVTGPRFSRLLVDDGTAHIEVAPGCTAGEIEDVEAWFGSLQHSQLAHSLEDKAGKKVYLGHLQAAVGAKDTTTIDQCVTMMARPDRSRPVFAEQTQTARIPLSSASSTSVARVARSIKAGSGKRKAGSTTVDPPAKKTTRRDEADDDDNGRDQEAQSGSSRQANQRAGQATTGARQTSGSTSGQGASHAAPASGAASTTIASGAPIRLARGDVGPGEEVEHDRHPLPLGAEASNFHATAHAAGTQVAPTPDLASSMLRTWCDGECPALDHLLAADDTEPGHDARVKQWVDMEGDDDIKLALYTTAVKNTSFKLRAVTTAEMDQLVGTLVARAHLVAPAPAPPTALLSPRQPTPHLARSLGTASQSPALPSPPSESEAAADAAGHAGASGSGSTPPLSRTQTTDKVPGGPSEQDGSTARTEGESR